MNIAIVGTGYVGLVSGACFSEMGIDVTCVDIDADKIEGLRRGEIPIYEPGLEELVKRNVEAGRLHFVTDLRDCLQDVEVVFSAVGTPPDEDGSADLKHVLAVAKIFGENIRKYTLLVTKSTVPVGTAQRVKAVVAAELETRGENVEFDVAANPEFLKEGAAIYDFMTPDRVVVGTDSERARKIMARLYKPFMLSGERMIFTDISSAEMIKYAANSMLATRISFMNDIANLCERVGADVEMVRKGIGSDTRIGKKFLYPGCGYGGSCLPKDVKALIKTAEQNGYRMRVLEAVEQVNERQKSVLFDKLSAHFGGELKGKTVALWGLSFKPDTDDMREAPSLVLIEQLHAAGCRVQVYDPIAMKECRRLVGDGVNYCDDMYVAATDADALLLVTEWKMFRIPSWTTLLRLMRTPLIIDGRNIYDRQDLIAQGFTYCAIGK
ncbi:MAG: UDP-glucose/GDP-mannose dehydrogenase family protein [Alistipes sp.]|nr:UDP-glucose/GDP-mannose dehydrogenase family protein [Alistipes sp.]